MKFFCIGRNKTGTTSLKMAFLELGFKVGNQKRAEQLADAYYFSGEFDPIIEYCKSADVFQDIPFSYPETYKHLDKAYPGSKFILTVRDSPEQWYNSITKFHAKLFGKNGRLPTSEDLKEAKYIRLGYMYNNVLVHKTPDSDPYNKEIMIAEYNRHNKEIVDYFRNRQNDLLVINLSDKNAYRRFLDFVGVESSKSDFPWENKTADKKVKIKKKPYEQYKEIVSLCEEGNFDTANYILDNSFSAPNMPMAKLSQVAIFYYENKVNEANALLSTIPLKPMNPVAKRLRDYWFLKVHIKCQSLQSEAEIIDNWSYNEKISVLCTAYNQENYIDECIKSILRQNTKHPYEVIIHDDASTDRTAEIIRSYQEKYPEIIKPIFQNQNQYSTGANPIRIALKAATGDYVCYCEGDDFWLSENKLENQAFLLKKENIFLCFHDHLSLNEVTKRSSLIDYNTLQSKKIGSRFSMFDADAVIKRQIPLPRINTVMHKSLSDIDDLFPAEIDNVVVKDQFLAAIGGLIGCYGFIADFPASVFRINSQSSWTPLNEKQKLVHTFSWRAWLSIYLSRRGMSYHAEFYRNKNKGLFELANSYVASEHMSGFFVDKFRELTDNDMG